MAIPGWRTALVVQGVDLRQDCRVPVMVGLVDAAAGGTQLALRIGDGKPVILAVQDASQLALNLNEAMAERLKVTTEGLNG